MTLYFQHVGEAGGKRDFPKTIGTPEAGIKQFQFTDISYYITEKQSDEIKNISDNLVNNHPDGFQIWGIPSGAKHVLRDLKEGDTLFLLETTKGDGNFYYGGEVVGFFKQENFELSKFLWGEDRFPLIVLLKGYFAIFSWRRFCIEFGYKENWNPAGQTVRVSNERFANSSFIDEFGFLEAAIGFSAKTLKQETSSNDLLMDCVEVDFSDREAIKTLRLHLIRERSARLIKSFKLSLTNFSCKVCGFDFERFYGAHGKNFIEAHHENPIALMEENEETQVSELVPLCSNCHQMIHRSAPILTVDELKKKIASQSAYRQSFFPQG